ncbi:bifunctional lytic transglycosylase/C40 family peptidase [Priestia megaterium]|uniref:bifunctional lytic transglycosylase/C40 family peptidase n=1 Tax=Priestia megaterium TaxID=1404 RepID=UPI002FFFE3AD
MQSNENILKDVGKAAAVKGITSIGALPTAIIIIAIAILSIVGLFIAALTEPEDQGYSDTANYGVKGISSQVMQFKGPIEAELAKQGMDKSYANVLLAIMQQESGGNIAATNGDVMQSSESMSGGKMGVITDPNTSILYGVKHFKNVLSQASNKLDTAIQSYNFGTGFIGWLKGSDPTLDKRFDFSAAMKARPAYAGPAYVGICRSDSEARSHNACYGDPRYLDRVKNYLVALNNGGGGNVISNMPAAGGNEVIEKAIATGMTIVGKSPYVWGGGRNQADIDARRFDCSSFVRWAYAGAGVNLGAVSGTTTDTLVQKGKSVSKDEMKRGDLVFFDTYKRNGHIGIYLGEGKFINDSSSQGVSIGDMNSKYWSKTFKGVVKRVVE